MRCGRKGQFEGDTNEISRIRCYSRVVQRVVILLHSFRYNKLSYALVHTHTHTHEKSSEMIHIHTLQKEEEQEYCNLSIYNCFLTPWYMSQWIKRRLNLPYWGGGRGEWGQVFPPMRLKLWVSIQMLALKAWERRHFPYDTTAHQWTEGKKRLKQKKAYVFGDCSPVKLGVL